MKLALIAIFSVILLVACEPQQEVLADGDVSGHKSYGRNTRFDGELEHDQRSDRNRNNESRGQERDSNREDYKDRNRNDDRNKEKQSYRTENDDDDRSDDKRDKKNYEDDFKHEINDKKRDRNRKNDSVDGKDDKNRDKNEEKYQDKNSKKDYREENYNNNGENSRNQNKDSKRENDKVNYNGNKNYERQNQYDKGSRGDSNERSYEKQGRDMGGKNNYGSNYDDEDKYKGKDKDDENKKYTDNENYQQKDNKYYEYDKKNYNDGNNNKNTEKEYNIQDKGNNKFEYERKYNYGSNSNYDDQERKKDKFRDEKNSRDTDKEYNKQDKGNNKYESNNGLNSNNQGQNNQDINRQRSYQDGQSRYDKQTKRNKDDSDKYDYDSNKNKEKNDDGYNSEYKEDGRDSKYREKDQYSQNIEKQKYGRSKSESRGYDNEDKLTSNQYDNRYSYLESLITAPKQKYDGKVKAKERKGEVIEIRGYISKGNEKNDKQVEVDVILKKADTTSGKGEDSKGGIRIHTFLNNEAKGYQIEKPQSKVTYEYIISDNEQDNKEKDYKELFKNHVQNKKEFLGGMELLGIISNIGQEIKEQVIEKIPGYNIIQNLDPRRPKNENKQYYEYNQEKKYPKIDLEVYSPLTKIKETVKQVEKNEYQIDEKGKQVKETKIYTESSKQDKGIDYTKNKSKKDRISSKNSGQVNKSDGIESKGKSKSDFSKSITVIKEKEINDNFKAKGNQESEGYPREKDIYDYTVSHKQDVYNIEKNKAPQAKSHQEYYEYNQEKKYPKIDLEVYSPLPKIKETVKQVEKNEYQIDEKGKQVKETKIYTESPKQDKGIDYTKNKSKKDRISSKNSDQVNKSDGIESKGKSKSDFSKSITVIKEKEINYNFKAKGNQESEGYPREKDIYDYTVSHKQDVYNIEKNMAPQAKSHQEYYDPGDLYLKRERDPWIQTPGTTQGQVYNHQQNGIYQEPYIPRQNPMYNTRNNDYPAYLDRDINRDYYQNLGYIRHPDRINLQPDYNKQRDYIYGYSIGKQGPLKNYEAPYPISPYKPSHLDYNYDYRPANQYNEKNNYGTKANEDWSYQGYHIDKDRKESEGENYPKYNKDQDNIRRGNEGYQGYRFRDPYNNKGYPDYNTLPNPGPLGGYGTYQPQPYPLPDLINPLSQQVLGSSQMVQFDQNYTKNLGRLSTERENNPYSEESRYTASYPSHYDNYERNKRYDAYQGANQYVHQYQLPHGNAFARFEIN